ncbi:MAG: glycosyltransferase family 9 protein [Bacteroidetes bacterium]|nr:glycosyltransferase family 9 protein [Bacteroidota bacterium]
MLSRTDSIGDVILTLPMAGVIKRLYPECHIIFLGRTYTKDVIVLSEHIDEFIDYTVFEELPEKSQLSFLKEKKIDVFVHVFPKKEIASIIKKAGIPVRIGTTNRLFHWFTCNEKVRLSRKNSPLHESQLNLKLLAPLGITKEISLAEMPSYYGFSKVFELEKNYADLIDPSKFNLILHPRSKGSAKEWGLENFGKLVDVLPKDRFRIFISGTKEDGDSMRDFINAHKEVNDLTGKLSLQQFISFINSANGLVAASTGPLHIAASLGKKAIGLFSPKRPIHPGRWMPVGKDAHYIVFDSNCEKCARKRDCDCITKITAQQIVDLLNK